MTSLRGRAATDPLGETAGNFARSLPMVAFVSAASLGVLRVETTGAMLAVTSGALASGVGYAIWYAALPGLTATIAATVQLSVPVLAAMGGVILMAEAVTPRLVTSSLLIVFAAVASSSQDPEFASSPIYTWLQEHKTKRRPE